MNAELREMTAKHEAAHAVMRGLRGLEPTEINLHGTGGICAGSGRTIEPADALLVALAGFAWESGCGLSGVDFSNSRGPDFDEARGLLRRCPHLRVRLGRRNGQPRLVRERVPQSLQRWFNEACTLLLPHLELIDELGEMLLARHRLPARRVVAMIRAQVTPMGPV